MESKKIATYPHAKGKLIMLSTHIGCPEDIPSRSIKALKEAELLVFEDDRQARLALKTAGLHREYLKFSEHQQKETIEASKEFFIAGKTIAYMSDQGCPTLADPGSALLHLAYDLGCKVEVIPGPSSLTGAISAFPYPLREFHFVGFLPQNQQDRERSLSRYKETKKPIILMDTPYRRDNLLTLCERLLGSPFVALLAFNISMPDQAFLFGPLKSLAKQAKELPKGNFVLIIAPKAYCR